MKGGQPLTNVEIPKPKPFKNKLLKLPTALLDGVDTLIDEGHSADHIRQWLVENKAPDRLVPNRKTISTYIGHRRQRRMALRVKGREVITEANLADLGGVDPDDRPELIRRSIATVTSRVELIKRIQQAEGMSPSWERTLVDELDLLRKLVESGDDRENLRAYYEAVAATVVKKFLADLAPVIRRAADDIYGTSRTRDLMQRLVIDYRTIDSERLLKESYEEVDALLKGETDGSTKLNPDNTFSERLKKGSLQK